MAKADLTARRLRELLHYDPETGIFTRLRGGHGVKVGDAAGSPDGGGYLRMYVDGAHLKAHRLAWLYMHGEWPRGVIDHIDGNGSNNCATNLRDVPQQKNIHNQRRPTANTRTGLIGVGKLRTNRERFYAQINTGGKRLHLGTYDSPDLARAAYLQVKREIHVGFVDGEQLEPIA